MKIGDKVKVTYSDSSQKIGYIVGETAKMWQIDFDADKEGAKRILKTMDIVLVDDPKTSKKEVVSMPAFVIEHKKQQQRNLNQKYVLIGLGVLAVVTFAFLLGFGIISI